MKKLLPRRKEKLVVDPDGDPVVLVCKIVPPGTGSIPSSLHMVRGDSLVTTVVFNNTETGEEIMRWSNHVEAQMNIIIEFDYMEIRSPGGSKGKIFQELTPAGGS